jgi:ATP phosphoribosyltransferase
MSGSGGSVFAATSAVLEERRLAAVERLVELRLALGESGELVGDLRQLIAEHPLWQTLRGHLASTARRFPGLESPTISPLHTRGRVAVRAMVPTECAQQIMDDLYAVGAWAILTASILAHRI